MNILLVEDNPSIRENTADWFRRRGNAVTATACAFSARRELVKEKFQADVMVFDLQLPCGQEAVVMDWLKQGGGSGTPVVVWTAKRDVEEDLPGLRIVYKPCSNEELEAALLEVVAAKAREKPTEPSTNGPAGSRALAFWR